MTTKKSETVAATGHPKTAGTAVRGKKAAKSSPDGAKKSPSKEDSSSRCWPGYEPTPGRKPFSKGSCRKIKN